MTDDSPFCPAEVTVGRAESFYRLMIELGEEARQRPPEKKVGPLAPETLADVVDDIGEDEIVLEPSKVLHFMYAQGRARELASIVIERRDGTPLTPETAGDVPGSTLEEGLVFFALAWGKITTALFSSPGASASGS